MKFLFDLLPVILFFGLFKWGEKNPDRAQDFLDTYAVFLSGHDFQVNQAPIMLATVAAVLASVLQIAYLLVKRQKIDATLWLSLFIVVVFGGLTLYFQNETFIKWKPTVLYWAYALVLVGGQIFLHKNFTKALLGKLEEELSIPELVWARLNLIWIGFLLAMGGVNLLVAYTFSTAIWVNFKLFGSMIAMFVFLMIQMVYLVRTYGHQK